MTVVLRPVIKLSRRDERRARIAAQHGMSHRRAVHIIESCRRWHLPMALGFALFEHESGFRNIFGHDPTAAVPARLRGRLVTKARYLAYRARRKLGLGMQGVGPGQLTWWQTQDYADAKGGCHLAHVNIDVAIETLAARIREFGYVKGIERYNGGGEAAVIYSRVVRELAAVWKRRLAAA